MGLVLALLLPGTASAQLAQQHSFNVRGDVEIRWWLFEEIPSLA